MYSARPCRSGGSVVAGGLLAVRLGGHLLAIHLRHLRACQAGSPPASLTDPQAAQKQGNRAVACLLPVSAPRMHAPFA
jgi:hypothetical protein